MVRRRLHKLQPLAVALVVAACLGPPTLANRLQEESVPSDALVRLSEDRAVAAKRDGDRVRVLHFASGEDGWGVQEIASETIGSADLSLALMSLGGETDDEWNTYVYGVAPANVSRVRLAGYESQGGQVANGAWVIALREKDLLPADLHWEFLSATGGVVESGEGIFPPAT